jgi:hypothetical protein
MSVTTRCVKVVDDRDVGHVVAGSQGDNLERMAKMRRGGGRYLVRRGYTWWAA